MTQSSPVRSRAASPDPSRKNGLSPPRQRLVEQMQKIGFGRIEGLLISNHQPQWRPAPRVLRDVVLGKDNSPRRSGAQRDFTLKGTVRDLFRHLDTIKGTAKVRIVVQDGLPIRLTIEQLTEA